MGDGREDDDGTPKRGQRRDDVGLPPWAKLALVVVGLTVGIIGWVELRFVSRVEFNGHVTAQAEETGRFATQQRDYAVAEKVTAANLGRFDVRLSTIETKIDILLDRNVGPRSGSADRNGTGTQR